MVYLFII